MMTFFSINKIQFDIYHLQKIGFQDVDNFLHNARDNSFLSGTYSKLNILYMTQNDLIES
jgi:hypothetical protein